MKMLKLVILITVATFGSLQIANAGDNVGIRQLLAPSPERGVNLEVTVWYPAQSGGEKTLIGDNRFFIGSIGMRDAPILEGKYPLILLSHGAGGYAPSLGWIAAPLVRQGFIVAAPNHPGSTSEDESAAETFKFWNRPADLTNVLNAIEKEATFQNHVAMDRVGALGFSLGGYTVLANAGLRIDPQLLATYCDTDMRNPYMCKWARESGVDLHTMNLQPVGRDNSDKRIRSVVAVDPGPTDTFSSGNLSDIIIPIDLINFGRPGEIPPTLQASGIAKSINGARYSTIEDAVHVSFLSECKPGAENVLKAEKKQPLCTDGGGRTRGEIHAQLIDMISNAFNQTLKANQ